MNSPRSALRVLRRPRSHRNLRRQSVGEPPAQVVRGHDAWPDADARCVPRTRDGL